MLSSVSPCVDFCNSNAVTKRAGHAAAPTRNNDSAYRRGCPHKFRCPLADAVWKLWARSVTLRRVNARKAPGMRMIHQLPVSNAFSARESILPQEMVSSGRPKPIKLKVDSATMAERMFMTTINRMDEKKFGARWPNSSRKKPPPMHRLATMYPL